ncbi:glycosyltransferase family 39 protein, partial [Candidatus Roizmanbacteria bacterium]|nr:glycosyltransferase family 39 protein [Candidatus Roizmanbacteria bacterium]
MSKINWKTIFVYGVLSVIFSLLIYTRFVNLGWGLPYPMHPDERNMANAVQGLNCNFRLSTLDFRNCFNPHFFAYGQFPLYVGYAAIQIFHLLTRRLGFPISFIEAVMALRIISAIASVLTTCILLKILVQFNIFRKKSIIVYVLSSMIFIFSPVLIQFAHFGTTESLLMLFYTLIIYSSLLFINKKIPISRFLLLTFVVCGFALATKISSVVFIFIPLYLLFSRSWYKGILYILLTCFVFAVFSPHNVISFVEFFNSLKYESDVATGRSIVFYTRQFRDTLPVVFQITKIFPYTLGLPVFLLGIVGFFGISWKRKDVNLLRFAFLLVFLPNAFLYAKWVRFMAPAFPLVIIFAIVFLSKIRITRFIFYVSYFIMMIPGFAYLSIYQNPDVRFTASEWIYKNIPSGSRILSETANVVDIPLTNNNYRLVSFNFYDLDQKTDLQQEFSYYIKKIDYIIVPSRRIFKNHSKEKYPLLNTYYKRLFSGELGFKQVAEFTSYPTFQIVFPDENAEETWTVFDHPV